MTRNRGGDSTDAFVACTVVVRRKLERSVILAGIDDEDLVCGRSLLSYKSEEEIDEQFKFPVTLQLEIRKWFAKREGLI